MGIADLYTSFADLSSHEIQGRDFHIQAIPRSSRLGIFALHGGGIEPGTSELATALAGDRFTLYILDGCKQGGSTSLHLNSTRFDEPVCRRLLSRVETAVTLHGCKGIHPAIYPGGLDNNLLKLVIQKLSDAGFLVLQNEQLLAGKHPQNICNLGTRGKGLQLELTEGLRRKLFKSFDRLGRQHPTHLFLSLISTLNAALDEAKLS